MNKQEYLSALRERLSNYSPAFIDEITEAFEEHFTEGESQGLSEAEVIDTQACMRRQFVDYRTEIGFAGSFS